MSASAEASEPVATVSAQAAEASRRQAAIVEWRGNWLVVVAAMTGLSFSSVAPMSMSVFIGPLSREFGWSRATAASGMAIFAAIAVVLAPMAGILIDRWGSRRMAIPGVILTALALAGFSQANGTPMQWLMLWSLYALVAVTIKAPVWTAAVTSKFIAGRGLALAITLCGTAIAQTLTPSIGQWLIATRGWREAYVWLAVGWAAVTLIITLLFFFDAHDSRRRAAAKSGTKPEPLNFDGITLKQALRNSVFLRIAGAALLSNLLVGGFMVHEVPLLQDLGLSAAAAAAVMGATGAASIAGKLFSGWLLDRTHAGWIAGPSLALPAVACALLLQAHAAAMQLALVAVAIFGYVAGAQYQLITYLTGRYCGMRSFGKIYGLISGLIALGIGIGPILIGLIFDHAGNYTPVLIAGVPIALVCGLLLTRLGPYPQWQSDKRAA